MSLLTQWENLQVSMPGCISHNGPPGWHDSGFCQYLQTYLKVSSPFEGLPNCTIVNKSTGGAPLFSVSYKEIWLSVKNGCLFWGSLLVLPHTLRQQVLKELHQCHLNMVKMKALAWNYVWWPKMDADIEEKVNHCYTSQCSRTSPVRAPLLIITDAHSKWIRGHKLNYHNWKVKVLFCHAWPSKSPCQ